jgi:hypothetical protein
MSTDPGLKRQRAPRPICRSAATRHESRTEGAVEVVGDLDSIATARDHALMRSNP